MEDLFSPDKTAHILLMAFFAITFLQSAIDKVLDRKGNLEFLNAHFKSSPLSGQVSLMLSALTFVEFVSGLLSVYAIFALMTSSGMSAVKLALTVCGVNLLMLLFGQRLAKDYAGASTIGIYMILVVGGFLLL